LVQAIAKASAQEDKKRDELTLQQVVQSAENLSAIKAELWEVIADNAQLCAVAQGPTQAMRPQFRDGRVRLTTQLHPQ